MRILSIGEILWDLLPKGAHLGGAPLNFAFHARRLNHQSAIISAVGEDSYGHDAIQFAAQAGIETRFIQRSVWPTGMVRVQLASGQPSYRFESPSAYEYTSAGDDMLSLVRQWHPDWIYFGTLFGSKPQGLTTIKAVVEACPSAKCFYDVNLRPGTFSREAVQDLAGRADILKLSSDEKHQFAQIVGVECDRGTEPFLRALQYRLDCESICLTRGACGCALLWHGDYVECPGFPIRVVDAVGAGDAFSAAILHAWNMGLSACTAGDFANRVGALVASRAGATPTWQLSDLSATHWDRDTGLRKLAST